MKRPAPEPSGGMNMRHGLVRSIHHGCDCPVCDGHQTRAKEWLAQYLDGASMEEIAARSQVSRQFVNLVLDAIVGGYKQNPRGRSVPASGAAHGLLRGIQAREYEEQWRKRRELLQEEAERDGVTCVTCGRGHARTRNGGWAKTCSPECAEMWDDARYFVDELREAHRARTASWVLRNPDRTPDSQVREAKRRMAGQEARHGNAGQRWLIEGSKRWHIALKAYEEGWPAFDTWHEDIRRQIVEHAIRKEGTDRLGRDRT